MRLLVVDRLRCTFVHVGVRLQLKEKVQDIDQQQDDTDTAADFEDLLVGQGAAVSFEGCVECGLRE